MKPDLEKLCVPFSCTFRDAVAAMDRSRLGIVLVLDEEQRLKGTITDGDVRRALLASVDVDGPVSALLEKKAGPITANVGEESAVYLAILQEHKILHLPLVDQERHLAGLITRDDFFSNSILPLEAVVMAGGMGTRLRPLTEDTPKPMLTVGDRPLMEIIIGRLRDAGIKRVNIATHHQAERITSHFGNGDDFGIEVRYVAEERPLGTAGALGLMEQPQDTTLVINGDILTQMDFRSMLTYHREHGADVTIGVRKCELKLPYGTVDCTGSAVNALTEKPEFEYLINAGIYLLEPAVYSLIPNGENFDMTELIQTLLKQGRPVVAFPIREYWLDIGKHDDYEQAQVDIKTWT